jgi:molybdopterin-biosynthesis enzyme MoeA-like protein
MNHYFVPGFPSMAWPMVEGVLQSDFSDALRQTADIELLIHTRGVYEGSLIPLIEAVLSSHPGLKIACLPKSDFSKRVELGVKGAPQRAKAGFDQLCTLLDKENIAYQLCEPDTGSVA